MSQESFYLVTEVVSDHPGMSSDVIVSHCNYRTARILANRCEEQYIENGYKRQFDEGGKLLVCESSLVYIRIMDAEQYRDFKNREDEKNG